MESSRKRRRWQDTRKNRGEKKGRAARVVRQHRVKYRDIPHELKLFTNKH